MEKKLEQSKVEFSDEALSWQYSLEDLDNFKDLPHLIHLSVNKVIENLPCANVYFFVLQSNFHEYREIIKEGSFSIQEDSQLITYLALKNVVLDLEDITKDPFFKQREEEVLSYLFAQQLKANVIVPIVYRFRLLGFIVISLQSRKEKILTDEELNFLNLLKESLKVNMYAAILIDKRFYELLILSDLSQRVQESESYKEILPKVIEMVKRVVDFDAGVYYEYNEFTQILTPVSNINLDGVEPLEIGHSVSGFVFQKQKPVMVNTIKDHVFFNEINRETFIQHAFMVVPFVTSKKAYGVLTIVKNSAKEEFSVDQMYLMRIASSFITDIFENKILYEKLEESYFDTIRSLTKALEMKDNYTKGHSERVMMYSVGIAEELNLSQEAVREIRFAAILHDIGKIGISENIITKPGRLTNDEFVEIQTHPEIGSNILANIDFLNHSKDYVKYHHEKIDGSGYYGKSAGEYPWESTIINLADSYDALTSDRSYRKAIQPEIALIELKKAIGKQYDQRVFNAFVRFLKKKRIVRKSLPL